MSTSPDINMAIAGALSDMSLLQSVKEKQRAYRQAAGAVRNFPSPLDRLVDNGTLPRIPSVGPSSSRIILEVIESGDSATVERAVAESGRRDEVEARRRMRRNFLSRAVVNFVLDETDFPRCRADFQMHSNWSDGSETLDAMADGCLARGYTHAAITDHSAGLPIARGLSEERLMQQREAIGGVNARLSGRFRLLQGVEANILDDGELDVPEAVRASLDLVVAAPHAALRSTAPQTERFLHVVRAPNVHILGHPTGRKYDARAGVVVNWRDVFDAAAKSEVAIEIDGDPSRQDCDFELASYALDAGCLFALDSDAHAVDELDYADIARAHAALAGIPSERVINCWPLERLLGWLDRRRN